MRCILAVIIGLLSMIGNTIMLAGGVVIVVPSFIIDAISSLSYVVKKWLGNLLKFEFPWWQPLKPGTIINKVFGYLKKRLGDYKRILDWIKSICK